MKRLIQLIIALLSIITLTSEAFAAHILANSVKGNYEFETNTRLFLKLHTDIKLFTEVKGRWEVVERNDKLGAAGAVDPADDADPDKRQEFRYRAVTIGPYYRLFKNLKIGAFYRGQQGARHDDDWVRVSASEWKWNDVRERSEHLFIGDVTPRLLLDFLQGANWVAELKTRYEVNTTNEHQTVIVRPGLTYFGFGAKSGKPLVNFFFQYELWLPVNYGDNPIWETWIYSGFLVHATSNISVGFHVARKMTQWSRSESFKTWEKESSYGDTGKFHSTMFGLNVIFKFEV